MSYYTGVVEGTGKAHCRLCGEVIDKGSLAIKVDGFRMSLQIHFNTAICRQNKKDVEREIQQILKKQLGGRR